MSRGATIPPVISPVGEYNRAICIPASPEWLALVTGALYVLTQAWYWDSATGDVAAVVERAKQMYFDFQDQSGACAVTMPAGAIMNFGGSSLPDGWLYCNGDELLKSAYPELFAAIGTLWGTPTLGSDYFVLPDMRNRSTFGYDVGNPSHQFNYASYHGAQTHDLQLNEIPPHDHTIYYLEKYTQAQAGSSGTYGIGGDITFNTPTGVAGGGDPHNNLHPVAVCNFIIFAG